MKTLVLQGEESMACLVVNISKGPGEEQLVPLSDILLRCPWRQHSHQTGTEQCE